MFDAISFDTLVKTMAKYDNESSRLGRDLPNKGGNSAKTICNVMCKQNIEQVYKPAFYTAHIR